jgi:kynurenine formamidase
MTPLIETLAGARVFDLAQPYFVGMPHHPSHPPYLYSLVKQHGEYVGPGEVSSASDAISLGSHVGTHIDGLSHFSCAGKMFGGIDAHASQTYANGMTSHAIDGVPPVLRRGVLLDFAADGILPADCEIGPADLEAAARAEVRPGDVVLIRTGWARYFDDPWKFIARVHGPGPGLAAARWLSEHRVFAAGSDTVAFEKVPDPAMPVHVHLLVESGIHIVECLNLEELAAAGVHEFLFIALPLKIRGGTASPIRPVAVVPR